MTLDERVARFLRDLAAVAEAVATENDDVALPAPADPELAELADAFNQMLGRIREQRKELEERDASFRSALNRLGDALTVTHDRPGIISAVLESSALSLGSSRGIFYAVVPGAGGLRAISCYGCELEGRELAPGAGLAGDAARNDRVSIWP